MLRAVEQNARKISRRNCHLSLNLGAWMIGSVLWFCAALHDAESPALKKINVADTSKNNVNIPPHATVLL